MNEQYIAAIKAEKSGNWEEALRLWNIISPYGSNTIACKMIVEAIEKGDKFRKRVAEEVGEEPDRQEFKFQWIDWYNKMSTIHSEIYNSKK